MKAFKTCLLIARNRVGTLITFIMVFIGVSIFSSQMQGDTMEAAFQGEAVPFTLVNRDVDSPMIQGLRKYLQSLSPEVQLEDDDYTLQNALYYGETQFIVIVPEGFSENWPQQSVQVSTRPDTWQAYYMNALLDSYFNQVKLQLSLHPAEPEKAVEAALSSLQQEVQVEKQRFGVGLDRGEGYQVYFRMVGYALIMLIYQFISSVQMVFGRKELRMRHHSSPLSPRRFTVEVVSYGALISVGVCAILLGVAFMLVAVTMGLFFSQFTTTQVVQAIISNFVALSLSFLGGLFVPAELMSSAMLKIARFLPTYWYADTFDKINHLTSYSAQVLSPIWQGLSLQLGFAVMFFCLSLLVSKYKRTA